MSHNLYCKELDLIQIGTYASNMILSQNAEGVPDGGWVGVARRLRFYLNMIFQGRFNTARDSESQKEIREFWDEEIRKLDEVVAAAHHNGTTLDFWIL